jgi:imidazole glycerol-phosphate synthase subunit HisH
MVAIIDYGVGNLFSLCSSFDAINEKAVITADPVIIEKADRIILPGVGAFEDAAKKLKSTGMGEIVKEQVKNGKPLMGICLGMQLLFDKSFEYGEFKGLGLIHGEIRPISDVIPKDYKIPHIGWNSLNFKGKKCDLFKYVEEGNYVYFVHSFYATNCDKDTVATTEYGAPLTAAVANGNVYGCQFHPEKSGEVGMKILKAFCELEA